MRRRAIDEPDVSPQINIVPMIDVIFAILTFFIMSTLFLGRFEGLSVNLPQAASAKPQQMVRATVTLNREGQLYLNRRILPVQALAQALQQLQQADETNRNDLVVILNADGAITHDRVVAVIDQVRQVKGAKLAIATRSAR